MEQQEKRGASWLLFGRVVFTIALLASVAFVFSNSMQVAEVSSQASKGVLASMQELVAKLGAPELAAQITEGFVRKLAHVCEYMLVGFWFMLCLRVYTKRFLRHITWPMFGCLFIALIDETIQLFSEGRSPGITDIWIDFFGSMLGILVALFLLCLCRMAYILYVNRER